MNILRIARHLFFLDWQTKSAFPAECLKSIERSVHASEQIHAGEIRFVVEGSLDGIRLFRGQSVRERALEVFSELRVWDTQHNNGVLIYVLLADRAIEVVADRGIQVLAGSATWEDICRTMQVAFSQSHFLEGSTHGIVAIASTIARHFPGRNQQANELSDKPVLLS